VSKNIVYIGNRDLKEDNVAATGLVWKRGEKHQVEDEKKAAMLLAHPTVWADADKPFELLPVAPEPTPLQPSEPTVQVVPQGGGKVDLHWEPIVFTVPAETFDKVRDKELELVFMSPEDAETFKEWKANRARQEAQAKRMRDAKAAKSGLESAKAA